MYLFMGVHVLMFNYIFYDVSEPTFFYINTTQDLILGNSGKMGLSMKIFALCKPFYECS